MALSVSGSSLDSLLFFLILGLLEMPKNCEFTMCRQRPGIVAHSCNPSTEAGGSPEVRSSRPFWPTWRIPVSTNTKISQVWLCAEVIPTIREAEAGQSVEPRRQILQGAEISTLHSSLSATVSLYLQREN